MMTYASCCDIAAQPGELPEGLAGLEGSEAGVAGGTALPPRILNITVPQVGHLPLMALRPFFITSSTPSTISFFALHLTQYPSGISSSCGPATLKTLHAFLGCGNSLRVACQKRHLRKALPNSSHNTLPTR